MKSSPNLEVQKPQIQRFRPFKKERKRSRPFSLCGGEPVGWDNGFVRFKMNGLDL